MTRPASSAPAAHSEIDGHVMPSSATAPGIVVRVHCPEAGLVELSIQFEPPVATHSDTEGHTTSVGLSPMSV
jgi:hypothetical protein